MNISFAVDRTGSGKFSMGEIALMDIGIEHLSHTDLLTGFILLHYLPVALAGYLRRFGGSKLIPDEAYERMIANYDLGETHPFDTEQFDIIIEHQIHHEVAELFWRSLPTQIKREWMRLYPLDIDRQNDTIFYRNFLRLYIEGTGNKSAEEFFAQETFADRLAMYWGGETPQILGNQENLNTPEIEAFFGRVMNLARLKHAAHGSVFAAAK